MPGFLIRFVISALGLWLAEAIVPGIHIAGAGTLLLAALLLGLVNAVVRPVLFVLTFPLTVVTLGLFLLVLNAGMLGLVALLLPAMTIDGFFSAVFGGIIVSIVSWLASWFIGPKGRVEVMVMRR